MKKNTSRLLSILLSLAMAVTLLPVHVLADETGSGAAEQLLEAESEKAAPAGSAQDFEPVFLDVPSVSEMDPMNLTWTVGWSLNFTPVALQIREKDKYEYRELDTPAASGSAEFSYDQQGKTFYFRAYYAQGEYVDSHMFSLVRPENAFLEQPAPIIYLNVNDGTYTVFWRTNFIPRNINLYRDGEKLYGGDYSELSNQMTLHLTLRDIEGEFTIEAEDYASYNRAPVRSNTFTLSADNCVIQRQPDPEIYISTEEPFQYVVRWKTSFVPRKVQVCRQTKYGDSVIKTMTENLQEEMLVILDEETLITDPLFIRVYYTEHQYLDTDLFELKGNSRQFLVQPGPQVYISTDAPLQFVPRWETNFTPVKIQVYKIYLPEDICVREMTENLRKEMLAVFDANAETTCSYYVRAYYTETGYIDSDVFSLSKNNLEFVRQPDPTVFDPDTFTAPLSWGTNFPPVKVEMVKGLAGNDWESGGHPVAATWEEPGCSPEVTLYNPAYGQNYHYLRAYYSNEDYILSDSFLVDEEIFEFTSQPQLQYHINGGGYTLQWETNFIPQKVRIHCNDDEFTGYARRGTIVAELTEGLGKQGSYTFETPPSAEYSYDVEAYYSPYYCEISDPFWLSDAVMPAFVKTPEPGSASQQNAHLIDWSTNFTPLRLALGYVDNGEIVRIGFLGSGSVTSFAVTWDMACTCQDKLFTILAWYGEGDDDYITTPGFSVLPRLEIDEKEDFSVDALGSSPVFGPDDWNDFYYAYTVYSNNAAGSGSFRYRINYPEDTANASLSLKLLDSDGNEPLFLTVDNWTLDSYNLPADLVTIDREQGTIEINAEIPALRQLFRDCAAASGLMNRDIFSIELDIGAGRANNIWNSGTLCMQDVHLPLVEEDWTWFDFDSFTLTTPLTPALNFPDAAPEVTAAEGSFYAVIATDGNELDENGQPIGPNPFPVYSSEDVFWQSYYYGLEHEVNGEYVPYPVAERFRDFFGSGYNRWIEGPSNPAPRGPANYIYGIAANKLTRSGSDPADLEICLADFMNSKNRSYLNSLPGLSSQSWFGYFEEGEQPDDWEELWYELMGTVDIDLQVTFADGVTYRAERSVFGDAGGDSRFYVTGEPYWQPGLVDIAVDGGSSYTIDGSPRNAATAVRYLPGEEITLEALGENFAYWTNSYGRVLSRTPSFTFRVNGAESLTAVYNTPEPDKAELVFESAYGQVMGRLKLAAGASVELPDVPSKNGYDPVGWDLNGDGVFDENDTLESAIASGLAAEDKTVTILPVYKLRPNRYTVTVTGGNGAGTYNQNDVVTVKADAAPAGKKFSHWTDADGKILSYSGSYSFFAEKDIDLTANFVDDSEAVEAIGTTSMINMYANPGAKKLSFVSMSTVPAGCRIEFAGILATDDAAVANGTFDETTAKFVRGDAWSGSAYRYTWNKSKVEAGTVWYARAYLVYTDVGGERHTVYGDVVHQSY